MKLTKKSGKKTFFLNDEIFIHFFILSHKYENEADEHVNVESFNMWDFGQRSSNIGRNRGHC